eukprot:Pompholyxophrys_sp_v1_NODE_325_length_751_cov_8.928161.p1 type:complete len:188 gc:universal NODE_325_length_751_cov_8.928161:159-722(+)
MKVHDIAYPGIQAVFMFDHSSGHRKFGDDALVASRMNKSSGGAQPYMRDTVWNGKVQQIGKKGAEQVLRERGLLKPKMKLDEMVQILAECDDFANEIPTVEHLVESQGHKTLWVPKFHCELNFIENVWGKAKQYTRANCNYTVAGLRKTIPLALDHIDLDVQRRFARKCRDYMRAYEAGFENLVMMH